MSAETKTLKCGLIMPISAIDGCSEGHWDDVRIIIKEALADTPFSVELVSDSNEIGIIQKRIVQNIYDNDIVVCDVSAKNPNVMFELGMRLAFDKPAVIIKDDKTNYSFDTSPIEHLQYPRDLHYHAIQNFKVKLREKVVATHAASRREGYTTFLKNFGPFVVAKLDEKPVGKDEYLIEAINELQKEVRSMARVQLVRSRHAQSSDEQHLSLLKAIWPNSTASATSNSFDLVPFASRYLSRLDPASNFDELEDSSSMAFSEMVKALKSESSESMSIEDEVRVSKFLPLAVSIARSLSKNR